MKGSEGMGSTLYELTGEILELKELLSDPEVDEQTIADTLEAVQGELESKAEDYVKVIRQLDAEAKAFDAEAEFFKAKALVRKNNIKRMKEALLNAMIATGHEANGLAAGQFTLKVQKNGGVAPLKITGDVPDELTRKEPDNEKIREYLKDHDAEWAHFEERGRHLAIK